MKILHIQCSSGIAGDMFAAACLDAGLIELADLQSVPERLGLPGVSVRVERVKRASIAATHISVDGPDLREDRRGHAHTHYERLDARLAASALPEAASTIARKIFRLLADAEASAHGGSRDRVVFHEVGSVDSIVDVSMAGMCIATIAAQRVTASPVPLGRGYVETAHGRLAVPPPATVHLMAGMPVAATPDGIDRQDVELATPTGVAILRSLEPTFISSWPQGTPVAFGLGAGSIDLGRFANVVRVVVLEAPGDEDPDYDSDRVVEIVCNLDDQSPERTAWSAERLLEMGALDVWITPILGKKGRPAVQLSVLVALEDRRRVADWILRETSTFGVRFQERDRWKLLKRIEQRSGPDGRPMRFAAGLTRDGTVLKEKPEYEDVRRYWDRSDRE